MDDASSDLYYQNLQDYVFDEDKIVSYKWLSNVLGTNISNAKKLLNKFVQDQKNDLLTVTYLVYGSVKNGSLQVSIEKNLDNIKSKYTTIISQHIFSVQKKVNSFDLNVLYSVDKTITNHCLNAAIKYENINERKDQRPKAVVKETKNVSTSKDAVKAKGSGKTNSLSNMFQSQNSKNQNENSKKSVKNNNENGQIEAAKKQSPDKPAVTVSKPNNKGIASFFSKQTSNGKTNSVRNKVESTKEEKKMEEMKKETNNKAVEESSEEQLNSNESRKNSNEKKNVLKKNDQYLSIVDTDDELMDVDIENKEKQKENTTRKSTTTRRKSKGKSHSYKRSRSDSDKAEQNSSKKRKRIVQATDSDSSDDDIFFREKSPSPTIDDLPDVPSSPEVNTVSHKNTKKGKTVEKVYQDEEGFMITKKEFVYETASEDENEDKSEKSPEKALNKSVKSPEKTVNKEKEVGKVEANKNETKIKPKPDVKKNKIASPKKQSTLMNFFKKT